MQRKLSKHRKDDARDGLTNDKKSNINNEKFNTVLSSKNSKQSSTIHVSHVPGDNKDDLELPWITSIAIFGDSVTSLILATIILLFAVTLSLYDITIADPRTYQPFIQVTATVNEAVRYYYNYYSLGPIPPITPPYIYSGHVDNDGNLFFDSNGSDSYENIHTAFYTDGVVAIRGLISEELLNQLDIESAVLIKEQQELINQKKQKRQRRYFTGKQQQQQQKTQFFTVRHNVLFYNNQTTNTLSSFARVAMQSPIPSIVAMLQYNITPSQLNEINAKSDDIKSMNTTLIQPNLRIIRDIFLAKDDEEYVCGWHVDDMGFWPATPESPGINAWIAIDDMPPDVGGGFAVAVQSHIAPWRNDAYIGTGASMSFPKGGYQNVSHMISSRTGAGTCNLQQVAPHIHTRMNETSRIYNIQRGDVIFHTRWLFHKTIPFRRNTNQKENDNNDDDESNENDRIYRRYSIRYGPGSLSIIPPGYGTEYSVLWNASNGGKSADDVCATGNNNNDDNTPWYPLAWPRSLIDDNKAVMDQFNQLVQSKFPIVEELAHERRIEMKPYLQRAMAQQHQTKHHH